MRWDCCFSCEKINKLHPDQGDFELKEFVTLLMNAHRRTIRFLQADLQKFETEGFKSHISSLENILKITYLVCSYLFIVKVMKIEENLKYEIIIYLYLYHR